MLEAAFNAQALEKAKGVVDSFKDFIEANKDEITACFYDTFGDQGGLRRP